MERKRLPRGSELEPNLIEMKWKSAQICRRRVSPGKADTMHEHVPDLFFLRQT
jgi:hypothetical protein